MLRVACVSFGSEGGIVYLCTGRSRPHASLECCFRVQDDSTTKNDMTDFRTLSLYVLCRGRDDDDVETIWRRLLRFEKVVTMQLSSP